MSTVVSAPDGWSGFYARGTHNVVTRVVTRFNISAGLKAPLRGRLARAAAADARLTRGTPSQAYAKSPEGKAAAAAAAAKAEAKAADKTRRLLAAAEAAAELAAEKAAKAELAAAEAAAAKLVVEQEAAKLAMAAAKVRAQGILTDADRIHGQSRIHWS